MDNNELANAKQRAVEFKDTFNKIKAEVNNMMVGQQDVVEGVLIALMAGGHVLLEGVPGLGKTMLVSSISQAVNLQFSRIQFTPDLMPADIQGSTVLSETANGGHELRFQPGPIMANLVLADEINRATPKTQSALLEVMQEKQVTVGRQTIKLDEPFCVMATQNPSEQEGTYPLPEAQLDRFLFKLIVGYPTEQDYHTIIDRTTSGEKITINPVTEAKQLCDLRAIVRQVPVPELAKSYAIRLVMATQPGSEYATEEVNKYVNLGASPRGIQGLMLAAKVKALLDDRFAVSCDDIKAIATPVLRHRMVLNFHAQASKVSSDQVIQTILKSLKFN
ncbi:MoxR family ATPase [Shewanella sp. A3A]|uniref:MoxR family ATPase n=1 Tax=Shewanella electrica TaxID=515560 RepID=A0ABT2FF71_9GAMM|nr:MoxR family ATPase [Shewanella electrica]MCH1917985.1 MoxR family ATPase [Shewanella ferrihydritica]MCH1925068.1 MoxR family ATPase [Shewanella electrica]MCS4554892.1 MoxR family ATPase [Shewanella electrica]